MNQKRKTNTHIQTAAAPHKERLGKRTPHQNLKQDSKPRNTQQYRTQGNKITYLCG
jgi:hypothetical protein